MGPPETSRVSACSKRANPTKRTIVVVGQTQTTTTRSTRDLLGLWVSRQQQQHETGRTPLGLGLIKRSTKSTPRPRGSRLCSIRASTHQESSILPQIRTQINPTRIPNKFSLNHFHQNPLIPFVINQENPERTKPVTLGHGFNQKYEPSSSYL